MKELFLFQGMPEKKKKAVISSFPEPVSFTKGEIVRSGDEGDCIGILISGTARCCVRDSDVVMRTFRAGDIFGVTDLFENNSVSTITAATSCSVIFIRRGVFQELLKEDPQLSLNYIRFLTDRILFLNKRIALYSTDSAQSKVYAWLKGSADESGVLKASNLSLTAKSLGIGRTSLYRALEQLEQKDIISRNGKIIIIKELQP